MSDYLFVGIVIIIFAVLGILYWLLVAMYATSVAYRYGAHPLLFGVIALFTNLIGVAIVWIYVKLQKQCPNCHTTLRRHAAYCPCCGEALTKQCPHCGHTCKNDDVYCDHCGLKIDEDKQDNKTEEL